MSAIKRLILKLVLAYQKSTKIAMAERARQQAAEAYEKARQYSVEACWLEIEAILLGKELEQ